jgi:ABC-type multidrug transport system ATPase subunit
MLKYHGRENSSYPPSVKQNSFMSDVGNYDHYANQDLFREEANPSMSPDHTNTDKQPYCLVWEDVSLTLKHHETILLNKVRGTARAGRVLTLMGPSGSGKTTLINVLGNRAMYGTVVGQITFGQRDYHTSDLYFVPLFDEVNNSLTVYEQIEFVGMMKCCDKPDMYERLAIVMRKLDLNEKAKVLCSDLTKGELKKVSVGMGMISKPSVLFMDEPTTGLDSVDSYSMVKCLIDLAETLNIAVVMSLHQPAEMVFDLLQDLYLLDGGRVVYNGPLSCCEKYFQGLGFARPPHTSPADFFVDLISTPPVELHHDSTWAKLYVDSRFGKNVYRDHHTLDQSTQQAPLAQASPSIIVRFYYMIAFFCRYYYREYGLYWERFICLVVLAFFNGTLFLQLSPETSYLTRYTGAIFFNIWTTLFSVVASTQFFARDRRQAVEQVKNAIISPGMYCSSQFLVSVPFNFISALAFQSIFHWLSRINPDRESFIYAVVITFGHLILMEAYMLCTLEILKNAMMSISFSMIILGYLFLFSGFFIKVSDLPAWIVWVSFITPTKYSFDGYLEQIYHSQSFRSSIPGVMTSLSGDNILENLYSQNKVDSWSMFGALAAWIAILRVMHYLFLFYQLHPYLIRNNGKIPSQSLWVDKIEEVNTSKLSTIEIKRGEMMERIDENEGDEKEDELDNLSDSEAQWSKQQIPLHFRSGNEKSEMQ